MTLSGNGTRDLPVRSTVPQPTASPSRPPPLTILLQIVSVYYMKSSSGVLKYKKWTRPLRACNCLFPFACWKVVRRQRIPRSLFHLKMEIVPRFEGRGYLFLFLEKLCDGESSQHMYTQILGVLVFSPRLFFPEICFAITFIELHSTV